MGYHGKLAPVLVGETHGHWSVIGPKVGVKIWCRCECGKERLVAIRALRSGHSRSCGSCGRRIPADERFFQKVEKTGSCWIWHGARSHAGYGRFAVESDKRWIAAHRFAYEYHVGPIPDGLVIDHLCRNPSCVNPAHLEPVTNRENTIIRGIGGGAARYRQTHCLRGHPLYGPNLYIHKSRGVRICRTCHRDRERARQSRIRSAGRMAA